MTSHRILALVRDVLPEVKVTLNMPWETLEAISHAVLTCLQMSRLWEEAQLDVTVAGVPDQHILCLKGEDQLMLIRDRKSVV
jgi:hypothetical protein